MTVINEYTVSRISIEEEETAAVTDRLPARHLIESRRLRRKATSPAIVIAAIVLLLSMTLGLWFYWRAANVRWANGAIARIEDLAREERYFDAYDLAIKVKK